ncbi:hypothetical protein N9M74_00885 [Pontimonas sp.]|nr:hypothetical protein [Pontimonas sp.]
MSESAAFIGKVAACIPTTGKNPERLSRAVQSILARQQSRDVTIYLVDNSLNGVEAPEGVTHHLYPGANIGVAGALELVRRLSNAEFLWSFQDDAEILCDNLTPLLTMMREQPTLGAITPVIDRNGIVPANLRAGFEVAGDRAPAIVTWPETDIPISDVDPDREFAYVFSCGTLYREAALADVGGFRLEFYPLGHIDVDVGLRLREAGWSSKVCPGARISHAKSGSTTPALGRVVSRLNTPLIRQPTYPPELSKDVRAVLDGAVIRRMSHLFLEVASEYEEELRRVHSHYENEIIGMRRTLSWRVTTPLRLIYRTTERAFAGLRLMIAKLNSFSRGDG